MARAGSSLSLLIRLRLHQTQELKTLIVLAQMATSTTGRNTKVAKHSRCLYHGHNKTSFMSEIPASSLVKHLVPGFDTADVGSYAHPIRHPGSITKYGTSCLIWVCVKTESNTFLNWSEVTGAITMLWRQWTVSRN
ncbi:hypothetical protein BDV34DRAFT_221611 [Aspergillus parasiticus]|uniref:Uncharacterized protein n=1 Tax=Aspergillus parasiticus TaxID=5067 RepID=A0A5N6DYL1_ASPPA|nr:hypothetical protein BDV34DRAFT_221611 [Aspergillus parasiticus]